MKKKKEKYYALKTWGIVLISINLLIWLKNIGDSINADNFSAGAIFGFISLDSPLTPYKFYSIITGFMGANTLLIIGIVLLLIYSKKIK